jgi:uncharacterized membrane protein YeiB
VNPKEPAPPPGNELGARIEGFDMARAVAILGMILVNFRAMSAPDDLGPLWLEAPIDRIEGKAAALFIVLAGVGIVLRMRAAHRRGSSVAEVRRSLLRRAAILFTVGVLNLHMWEWDILHCYGVYILFGALCLRLPRLHLMSLAAVMVGGAVLLQASLPYTGEADLLAPGTRTAELIYDGLFPLFPWLAFLLFGMALAKLNLRDRALQGWMIWGGSAVVVGLELLSDAYILPRGAPDPAFRLEGLLVAWPRPPTPAFVFSGMACASVVIAASTRFVDRFNEAQFTRSLVATGRMALTVYFAHAVAILVAESHAWFRRDELTAVVVYAFGFYLVCTLASRWWSQRFSHGPFELIVRQIADPPSLLGGPPVVAAASGATSSRLSPPSG